MNKILSVYCLLVAVSFAFTAAPTTPKGEPQVLNAKAKKLPAKDDVAQYLQDISVTIKAGSAEGSGVITNINGVNYVWTAAHVVSHLRKTRTVIDPHGTPKVVVQFEDAEVVKDLVEDGRTVGSMRFNAEVIRYSDADHGEDLALLKVRKKNLSPHYVHFYLDEKIPSIGTELFHVGSLLGHGGSNSMTTGIVSQQGRVLNGIVYDQTTCAAFPGCLTADTMISMADGTYKKIVDVKIGDRVISFGSQSNSLYRTTGESNNRAINSGEVTNFIESGVKDIYQIKTRNRLVKASGNHPLVKIVPVKTTTGKVYHMPVWTRADELKKGDIIAVMDNHVPFRKSNGFNFAKNGISQENILDFMNLLGFYVGDGYKRYRKDQGGEVNLYTFNKEDDVYYTNIVKKIFNVNVSNPSNESGNYLRVSSVNMVNKLSEWGFSGLAHTKRIPQWVYQCTPEQQKSFIDGLINADGWLVGKNYSIELCNKDLIEDVWMLCTHLGLRTSNIYERNGTSTIKGRVVNAHCWGFEIYNDATRSGCQMRGDTSLLSEDLRYERISSIDNLPAEMTYDLTVGTYSNFFANGVLVHNSSGGGVYLRDGRYMAMIVRGAGETFNLVVPIRRLHKWATKVGVDFTLDPKLPIPPSEDLKSKPVEDSAKGGSAAVRDSAAKEFKFLIRTPKDEK